MRPHVRLRSGGRAQRLHPGDCIGRWPGAALHINEPHISELHAMISLRGLELKLLGLRGRLSVGGKTRSEVPLREGLRILLGGRTALVVEALAMPELVPALTWDEGPPTILGHVTSLRLRPSGPPEQLVGFDPDAELVFWSVGDAIWCRDATGRRPLSPGDEVAIGDRLVRLELVPITEMTRSETRNPRERASPRSSRPMHLKVGFDLLHLIRAGRSEKLAEGIPARIVSELAALGQAVPWEVVAAEIWRGESDLAILRALWDGAVARLRKKLRKLELRDDLLRASGAGLIELNLHPADRLERSD